MRKEQRMQQRTKYEALIEAIKRAKGQERFADIIGMSQPYVSKLVNSIKELPVQFVRAAADATGVPDYELQPTHFKRPAPNHYGLTEMDVGIYGNNHNFLDKNGVAA